MNFQDKYKHCDVYHKIMLGATQRYSAFLYIISILLPNWIL